MDVSEEREDGYGTSSETLVNLYQTTHPHILEDSSHHYHRCMNLKFHKTELTYFCFAGGRVKLSLDRRDGCPLTSSRFISYGVTSLRCSAVKKPHSIPVSILMNETSQFRSYTVNPPPQLNLLSLLITRSVSCPIYLHCLTLYPL